MSPLKTIRLKCLDCSAGSSYEVKHCPVTELAPSILCAWDIIPTGRALGHPTNFHPVPQKPHSTVYFWTIFILTLFLYAFYFFSCFLPLIRDHSCQFVGTVAEPVEAWFFSLFLNLNLYLNLALGIFQLGHLLALLPAFPTGLDCKGSAVFS